MKNVYKRNWAFRCLKSIVRVFSRRPKYVFLGDEFVDNAIYLSNHVGVKAPFTFELFFPKEFRFWGTFEMNSSFKERFHYLDKIYFHQKKHIPRVFSFLISIIATPVMTIAYKGLNLISTYPDGRLIQTLRTSLKVLKDDKKSIIIFPENSSDGYHDELKEFFSGFYTLGSICYDRGLDIPIYLMYYKKKERTYIVDKPVMFSTLKASGLDKKVIAENFKNRANELRLYNTKK